MLGSLELLVTWCHVFSTYLLHGFRVFHVFYEHHQSQGEQLLVYCPDVAHAMDTDYLLLQVAGHVLVVLAAATAHLTCGSNRTPETAHS